MFENWYDIPLLIVSGLLLLAVFIWMGLMLGLAVVSILGIFVLPMIKPLYHLQRKLGVSLPFVGNLVNKAYADLPSTRKRLLNESELYMISLNGIYLLKNQSLNEKGMKVLEKTLGLKITAKRETGYLEAAADKVWEELSEKEKSAVELTVSVNGLTSEIWTSQAKEKLRETLGFFKSIF